MFQNLTLQAPPPPLQSTHPCQTKSGLRALSGAWWPPCAGHSWPRASGYHMQSAADTSSPSVCVAVAPHRLPHGGPSPNSPRLQQSSSVSDLGQHQDSLGSKRDTVASLQVWPSLHLSPLLHFLGGGGWGRACGTPSGLCLFSSALSTAPSLATGLQAL